MLRPGPARLHVELHEPCAIAGGEADDFAVDFGEANRITREHGIAHPGARVSASVCGSRRSGSIARRAARYIVAVASARRTQNRRRAAGGSAPIAGRSS